ncbi:MAG: hypothetical protein IPJ06_19660 [Saprospiraceae bacterium]|nr:hypothetical protein [Saprospiraceae bacterium]
MSTSRATASEINNDYFVVQHSTDGSRFDDLGTITGAGTSTQSHTYEFLHEHPLPVSIIIASSRWILMDNLSTALYAR